MRRLAVALAGLLVFVVPAAVTAQSLGEAAAREREKRKNAGTKPAKVYTERDLRSAGSGMPVATPEETPEATPAQSEAAQEGEGKPAAKEKTEEELRAEREKAWREQLQKANEDVTRLAGDEERLQTSLNDLSGNVYGSDRTARMNRLEEIRKQLAEARQKLEDLQEQGRRQGLRP